MTKKVENQKLMWPSEIFRISSYIPQECLVKISELWEWWIIPAQSHLDFFTCKISALE